MADIIKNLTVTRVKFQLVEVTDGVPKFVEQQDAVFRGVVSKERVKKLLAKQFGGDATIVILSVDSGQHRFVMPFEDFVRSATVCDIADGEDAGQDNDDDTSGDEDSETGEGTEVGEDTADAED